MLHIFICMQVPMELLKERGGELGLSQPWQFFWATGLLSSVLDNAPTYAVFFETAAAFGAGHGPVLHGVETINGTIPVALLRAVSLGAVLMGATTLHRQRAQLHGPIHRRGGRGEDAQLLRLSGLQYRRSGTAVYRPDAGVSTLGTFSLR
jgi:hypothetical protein